MDDANIQKLFAKLVAFIKVENPYTLRIRRRHFKKYLVDGFTNDEKKRIELDINSKIGQPAYLDDVIGYVLIHELLHNKFPEKSDFELFVAEGNPDIKLFKEFFGKEFPIAEEDMSWDVEEEEEWARKKGIID